MGIFKVKLPTNIKHCDDTTHYQKKMSSRKQHMSILASANWTWPLYYYCISTYTNTAGSSFKKQKQATLLWQNSIQKLSFQFPWTQGMPPVYCPIIPTKHMANTKPKGCLNTALCPTNFHRRIPVYCSSKLCNLKHSNTTIYYSVHE
jgi:hypothetical protein